MISKITIIKRFAAFTIIVLCFAITNLTVSAEPADEKIKVGYYPLAGFHEYGRNGEPVGFDVECLNALSRYTGWTYEFVPMESFEDALTALSRGKIDLLGGAQIMSRASSQYLYCAYPSGNTFGAMMVPISNNSVEYEDFKAFDGMTVGMTRNYIREKEFLNYQEENGFNTLIVLYNNEEELHAALASGEVNAIATTALVKNKDEKIVGKFAPSAFYYITNRNNTKLMEQLNIACERLENEVPGFTQHVQEQFYPHLSQKPLSKREQQFIQNCPTLMVSCIIGDYPLSDEMDGVMTGIIPEILRDISKNSGLIFYLQPIQEGTSAIGSAVYGKADMVAVVPYTNEALFHPDICLSMPIYKSNVVFAGTSSTTLSPNQKLRIALPANKGSYVNYIEKTYPNFKILQFSDTVSCLNALLDDQADIVMQDAYALEGYLKSPQYSEFVVLPTGGWEEQYAIALPNNSNPLLLSVLNKKIAQMPSGFANQAADKFNISIPYQITVRDIFTQYQKSLMAVASFGILLLLFIWMYRRQKRQNLKLLIKNQSMITHIANTIHSGVLTLKKDEEFTIIYANQGFFSLIGSGVEILEDLVVKHCTYYIHPDDLQHFKQEMNQKRTTGETVELDIRLIRPGGRFVPVSFRGTYAAGSKNEARFYCVIVDISSQRKMIEELEIEKERYRILIEQSEDIMFDFDVETRQLTFSSKFKEKFGWEINPREADGELIDSTGIHPDDLKILNEIYSKIRSGKPSGVGDIRIQKTDGVYIWCQLHVFRIGKTGQSPKLVGKLVDIDSQVKERNRLEQLSRRDQLTRLYHKEAFKQAIEERLSKNSENHSRSLLFVDLDYFKTVNDQLGHMAGDLALRDVTQTLKDNTNPDDIICRFGGDEFCVFLENITQEQLLQKAERICRQLRLNYKNGSKRVSISASIGIYCLPDENCSYDQALERADAALYEAKNRGRNTFVLFQQIQQEAE